MTIARVAIQVRGTVNGAECAIIYWPPHDGLPNAMDWAEAEHQWHLKYGKDEEQK